MKFHLVTYSDGEFKKQQDFINRIHGGVGVVVFGGVGVLFVS